LNLNNMKNSLILTIAILIKSLLAFGQSDQCGNNIQDLNGSSTFNWKGEFFYGYTNLNPTGASIVSPFYPQGNGAFQPNSYVYHFGTIPYAKKDFFEEDGWVEFSHDFGKLTKPTKYPYFVLYNKFTGVMRYFIAITKIEASSILFIRFQHAAKFPKENVNQRISASLAFQDSLVSSLSDINSNAYCEFIYPRSIGEKENEYFWIYHDVTIAYDPCICNSTNDIVNSGVSLLIKTIQRDVLNIQLTGSITSDVYNSKTPESVSGSALFKVFGSVTNAISAFNEVFSTYSEFKSNLSELKTTKDEEFTKMETKPELESKSSLSQFTRLLNSLGSAIPFVGLIPATYSFVNSLTSKEKPSPEVVINDSRIKINGTAERTFNGPLELVGPFPNSYQSDYDLNTRPVYQNTLGVFHLPKTPRLVRKRIDVGAFGGSGVPLLEYSLAEPIKYLLNPAAEVDPIDVKVALIFKVKRNNESNNSLPELDLNKLIQKLNYSTDPNLLFDYTDLYGPVIVGGLENITRYQDGPLIRKNTYNVPLGSSKYSDWVNNTNIVISDWKKNVNGKKIMDDIIFSTPLIPITDAEKLSILLYANKWADVEINLQVYLNVQSKNNPSFKNKSVFTYKCDYDSDLEPFHNIIPKYWGGSNHYYFETVFNEDYQTGEPSYYFGYSRPFNIYADEPNAVYHPVEIDGRFNNTDFEFSDNLYYVGKVTLSGEIKSKENIIVKINACNGFDIKPGTKIGSNIILTSDCKLGNIEALTAAIMEPSEIDGTICSNPTSNYYNNASVARQAAPLIQDSIRSKSIIKALEYQVFPNPAKNMVTIQSPNSEEVISKVVIKNILGVEVASFIIRNPASEVSIDVSGVPIGIYKLSVNNFSTALGIQR